MFRELILIIIKESYVINLIMMGLNAFYTTSDKAA